MKHQSPLTMESQCLIQTPKKTGRWARRNGRPVHHTPSVSSPINNESENDDGDVDEKNDEDRDDGYPDGASSTAPDSGAIDELTEIDLTSAIQRGKFILRARRNETPPPKKRKYTRRTAASPSGGTQPSFTSPTHSSRSADVNSTNDEGGSGEEESDRTGKKRLNRSNRALTRSSQRIPRESTSPVVSKEPDLVFSKNTVSSEQDELEALKLTNTIAARRKLRRSGLHSVQDDELLSLPLPTRTRTKSTPKDSFHIETVSASPESMIAPSAEPSASVTPFSGNTTGHTVQPKKTGRGKYIRKGKRESPAPDPPCDALCASCALARPNSTRHSLGWFMFYMLEDLSTSLRLQQPQYNCSFSGCHTAFYTELELKAHIQTHYSRVEQLYALPPMKKRKEEEVDEEADGPEPSDFAPPNPAQMELSRGSHPQQNGIHMDEDSSQQANSSAPQWAMDVASASKAEPKEVTFYECTYPDCNDGEGEPNWFDSENALQVHVEKAHCGGLGHRLCTRCGLKPVYYGAAPVQPVRAGRYTKHSASPATNCVFGRGRKLPFEPLQGLSDPNMIPLPMMNLSYHPPTPAAIPSPPPIAIPLAAMSAAMHISPPHSTNNGFGTVHNPSHHLQDENDDNRGDDDTDRPKRSTRIRRSSAAASQASSYISSPYGTTAKHMRAAATASSIAPAPAPTEPAPVRVAKHTSVPTTAANPPRKVSKKVAPSAPTNKTTQMPPPSSLPSTTRNQPPRATHPETEPIAPSDMNAFLDLINLCSSIVEH
jgi:hypothetical protein